MNINEIATKYIREEFLNNIKGNTNTLYIEDEMFNCPGELNLKESEECCENINYWHCKECWEKAVRNIKFKGE